jgi:ABC-type transporter Mla MlaB component
MSSALARGLLIAVPRSPTATTIVVLVAGDGTERPVACMDARRPDLALVEQLLRWELLARRQGSRVRLDGVPEALRELLELVGFAALSGLEAGRQPELGEQRGIEEVVQPGDPPA